MMSELRWTLLILGVLFIAVLGWWEWRRSRARAPISDASLSPVFREPTLTLPDIRVRDSAGTQELPVVEIPDDPLDEPDIRIPAESPELPVLEPAPAVVPKSASSRPAAPESEVDTALEDGRVEPDWDESAASIEPVVARRPEMPVRTLSVPDAVPTAGAAPEPIVDWPPDEERKAIALRLVAPPAERFSGRAVRQALAAEGFVFGKFAIFHKPAEDRRSYLCVASLTQPGIFDAETMDSQRYGGLSLFAVLPGPKSPVETFEDLLAAARNLNDRLHGALQDERGGPLTPMRIAGLRESVNAEAPS